MGKEKTQAELERIKEDFAAEERRANEMLEKEIKQMEEDTRKEIEAESSFHRNCLDIAIVKLRQATEEEIDRLSKERYAELGTAEEAVAQNAEAAAAELQKLNKAEHDRLLEKEREAFEEQCRERRARFEQHMMQLMQGGYRDGKNIDQLKKEVVPIVHSTGMRVVADEAVFDRYQIKITRNALATGESWALYPASCGGTQAVCLVNVLMKIPMEVRNQYLNSTKCTRFLCEKPCHPGFIKLHDIFITSQKMYTFMEPMELHTAFQKIANKKSPVSGEDIKKWCRQLAQAYAFMHSYAIAHLNIRTENVIFDHHGNAKVAGLSRAFLYFSLDQEVIIKAPMVEYQPYNSHYPPEAFDGPFHPQPADVYSFGLMMYEMVTGHNPLKFVITKPAKGKGASPVAVPKPSHRLNPRLFDFSKIANAGQRALMERMLSLGVLSRPKFQDILKNEYIGANGSDGRLTANGPGNRASGRKPSGERKKSSQNRNKR